MNKFDKIYLSWRASKGFARIIVGELIPNGEKVDFKYIKDNLNQAKKFGFKGYTGLNIEKLEYSDVLDLFSKRLINTDRSDSSTLLNFWDIEPEYKNDKLYVLAMTQGITQIDNFEFLANFQFEEGLKFVTDIAGLSYTNFDLSKIKVGYKLTYEKEKHEKDENAVKVLFKDELIGYIKKGHNMVFQNINSDKLEIEVKHIINPKDAYKQLFVRIFLPQK